MTPLRHRQLLTYLLLLPTLLPTWWSSEAMTNNAVSAHARRDNSLSSISSKLTSSAVKDPKSDWRSAAAVESSTPDRTKAFHASWTPVCSNYSCPSSKLDPAVDEPAALAQQPDLHPASAVDRQDVLDLMRSVSEELSGLRSALQHLKLDSQAVHRQVKRLHRASCSAARRARRRTKWTGSDASKQRLQNAGIVLQYMFSYINISQGSVATPLRCGGICNDLFIANFLLSVAVKEF